MTTDEVLRALDALAVETGSLACLGCGFEHNCDIHGCAIIREAETSIRRLVADNAALRLAVGGKALVEIEEFDGVPVARLRELVEADKGGRCVVLPCKVGERWVDEDGRAVRITAVIVSMEPFGENINIYFDYEDATPDDAGSDCVTNWDYFSRHYTCIEVERAMEGRP